MRENTDTNTDGSGSDATTDDEASSGTSLGIIEQISDLSHSRRDFMSTAAKTGIGAVALGTVSSGTAAAAHADEPYSDSPYEDKNEFGYGALTDVEIVRFALLLERLEATFYTEAVGVADGDDHGFDRGGRLSELEIEISRSALQLAAEQDLRAATFEYFQLIGSHERDHVAALEGVLSEVGSNPDFAAGVEFTFPYDSADEFISLAQVFEDTGAGAYTAAAPAVDTEEYLAAAAQILAVEARHASYLRVLTVEDQVPFPASFQEKLSVSTVAERVIPFVDGVDSVEQVVALVKTD
jgi:hypothetical protein